MVLVIGINSTIAGFIVGTYNLSVNSDTSISVTDWTSANFYVSYASNAVSFNATPNTYNWVAFQ